MKKQAKGILTMLRTKFKDELKRAMQAKEQTAVSTLRLVNAALKDRDIAARGKGNMDGISDEEILTMLQSMIKQRRDSIAMYEKGGRPELAEREANEITVIENFLPKQFSEAEIQDVIAKVMSDVDAQGLKDMGKIMGILKKEYNGQMDFSKASGMVKDSLAAIS